MLKKFPYFVFFKKYLGQNIAKRQQNLECRYPRRSLFVALCQLDLRATGVDANSKIVSAPFVAKVSQAKLKPF